MITHKHIAVLTLVYLIECSGEFTELENQIILSLKSYFQVSFCIFLDDERPSDLALSLNTSYPSRNNFFTTVMDFRQFSDYMKNDALLMKYGGITMVVVKMNERTLINLREVSSSTLCIPAARQFSF